MSLRKKNKQTKRQNHFIESNNQNNENIFGLGAIVWSSNEQLINKLHLTTGTSFSIQQRIKLFLRNYNYNHERHLAFWEAAFRERRAL